MIKLFGGRPARLPRIFATALLTVGLAATCAAASAGSSAAGTDASASAAPVAKPAAVKAATTKPTTAKPAAGDAAAAAQSAALVRPVGVHRLGVQPAAATPSGYAPADLRSAYNLAAAAASGGKNATVAIVDVGNDATAAADLAVYRAQYGLPACTTASGCLRQVNEQGKSSPLPQDQSLAPFWPLDMDVVSGICPSCRILLVDAGLQTPADLGTAVDTAVSLGAKYVVVGYDRGTTTPTVAADASYFNHPGVAITVPAGNSGYDSPTAGNEHVYPAISPYVTTVGGTTLQRASNARGWTETVWAETPAEQDQGTSSGCYDGYGRPSWELGADCSGRNYNDVAADADPATGVAFYNTDADYGAKGWGVGGGTTVSASIVGAVYALAGPPAADSYPASYPYLNPAALNPVTSGSDAPPGTYCAGPAYQCTAGPGYNGPAGLGTPDGTGAFAAPASASVTMIGLTEQTAQVLPATVSLRVPTEDPAGNPMTFTATGLPPGLAIDPATGLISGTISAYYSGTTSVTATDATGATATTSFGWQAENAMSFPALGDQQSQPDSAVSLTVKVSDPEPGERISFTAANLPTGLSIDPATGVISGTTAPLVENTVVTLTATDGTGSSVTTSFLWRIENTITVTAPGTESLAADAAANVPVSVTDSAAGQTITFSAAGLPDGLSIDPASGAITGSTTTAGEYIVTVTAADETGSTGSVTTDLYVNGKITITSPGNPTTTAGQAVQVPFTASDTADNVWVYYTLAGAPPGISVSLALGSTDAWESPTLTGFPAPAGTYHVTLTADGASTGTASVSFTWTVKAAASTGPKGPVRLDLDGKCLDDTGNKSTNGNKVQIWACNGGASQNWTYAQDGTLRINGKCLDAVGNGTKVGTKLQLWSCLNHTNQIWTAAYAAELAGAQSRLCLADPAASTKNGTQVELGACEKGASVEWTLPAGEIMSGVPSRCVTDAGGASANGTAIVEEPCANSTAQRWTFEPDGTLRILGKCLSTPVMSPGALAVLEPCGGSSWQQWGFGDLGSVGSYIDGVKGGLSYQDLEVPATASGTQLALGNDAGPGGHWFLW
jgi:hypothetical protein